ncbi:pericentrin isoform X2 [Tupaia chinensis]|uniref:pericentrin isoform X2 n=1 Tax=Tupaia chinensis TaxID=246437 RepID=UPI000FFC9C8F|nr:pericentrin isoform X2 [Tupaia chinensis]
MEEDEQEQRRKKVEAGRAKLAHFRQRKTKGDCAHSKKKTAKRKGSAVDAPVQAENPVAPEESGHLGGGDIGRSTSCSDPLDGASGACVAQECEGEVAALVGRPEDEPGQQPQAAMEVEQQAQTVPGLELEALRLSLSNMHTAQLELMQANLQREKETALTELREMLNGRHAQELALLQSRQQHELELLREQHTREKEEVVLRCGQEAAELKEKLQSEMEKSVQMIETLKQEWECERDLCLEDLRKELSAKYQSEMEYLQNQFQKELTEQKAELEKIFQAKNQAESTLQGLESQHQAAMEKLRADLQSEHSQYLEELESKFREKEQEKQRELENLHSSYKDLKAQSQEEIRHLWSQLDSVRTNRQELNESHIQLLPQTSHAEDLEFLKRDFEQQQLREKSKHEAELEQLRLYFEERLRVAEKTYQEDLALLQRRLQEGREDSLLESGETSSSCTFLEETPEKESKHCLDPPGLQHEQHKEGLACPQAELEETHGCRLGAWRPLLHIQPREDCFDGNHMEMEEQHSPELNAAHVQCAQAAALEIGTEAAAMALGLKIEQKVKLSLLQTELKEEIEFLRLENRNLHEKLQHEIHLNEDLEKERQILVEDHQEEHNRNEKKIQLMKEEFIKKEAEWKVASEDLKRKAEEKLTLMLLEVREKAESEKQSIINKFKLRETEMRQLQDQQAAQILDLEQSLTEQQGRLRQLEHGLTGDEALPCSPCGQDPPTPHEEDYTLQLMLARNRLLEERKAMAEKFATDQDAFLREAQEQHAHELQLLQERHQQHLLSVTAELEARHQAELGELLASSETKWQALLGARVTELQKKHAAEVSALEARHLSSLDSLESCYLSEIQTLRAEHRAALELLQADLEEQLHRRDSSHQRTLTQEVERLKLKHDEEPRPVEDSSRVEGEFESEKKTALPEKEERFESKQAPSLCQKEKEPLSQQFHEDSQIQQLKAHMSSLRHELEESRAALEQLHQRRGGENQEGANLLSMLRADANSSQCERKALQDALRRLLGLFGETLKATITLKSRIAERVGLYLGDVDTVDSRQAPSAALTLDETWSDMGLPDLDRTLPECAETSSVAEISSHICESFFMSPESTLECEQPIRRIYQSLGLAVDRLLEMALDSTTQLEEARQIHSRFEKEFSQKNQELAHVVRKQEELLEHLEEEGRAKTQLGLALHTAEGILEGLKVERAELQKALGHKEESEQHLVLELESLRWKLQQVAQEQTSLKEEHAVLRSQKEAAAAEAEEREAALRREVEHLTREQSDTKRQSEKDRSALLSQMKVLESELEEQLSQHQACAKQAEEVLALRQQITSLDKHLRNQRQFMDEQAAEREHEREEFQQEIQRLEAQLHQAARPQPQVPLNSQVELLQEKLREKTDRFNELVIKKELADRQVLIQEEEIKRLEEMNATTRRKIAQLQGELEKQKITRESHQGKEALEEQQNCLLPVSTLQSMTDEGKCLMPSPGSPPKDPTVQLEAAQRVHLQHESDEFLRSKEKEMCVSEQLQLQPSGLELSTPSEVVYSRSSEIEELKAIIENLQENQERLQKDRLEEVERLHEVIEKLQTELSLSGSPACEAREGQAESLQRELLCSQVSASGGQALQGELEAALATQETLRQLLANQEHGHRQALEALQQRLRGAEEAAARQLAEMGQGMALREAEVQGLASRIQQFEAALKAKEAMIAERDLEIDAVNKRKAAHCTELQTILSASASLRHALEQMPLAGPPEPPELQRLRAQCARLSRQLLALNQHFLRCHTEPDQQQAYGDTAIIPDEFSGQGASSRQLTSAPHGQDHNPREDLQPAKVLVMLKDTGLHKQESMMSVLAVCQRHLQSELLLVKNEMRSSMEDSGKTSGRAKGKQKVQEDCQLQKVSLIAQVKQLQEKLNRLVYSMTNHGADTEDFQFQQPLSSAYVLENNSNDSSCNNQESDTSPLVDAFDTSKTTRGVIDVKSRDSLTKNEVLNFPIQEKLELQNGLVSFQTSDPSHIEGAGLPQDPIRALDLSSWSPPEVLRKDSSLEPWPSFPLTPCSGTMSLRSSDTSVRDKMDASLLPANESGLLCYPSVSVAEQAQPWAEAPSSGQQHHVDRTAVENDVEDFIITSFDSQETSRLPVLGLEGKSHGSKNSDSSGSGVVLSLGSGELKASAAGPAAPAPGFGSLRQSLGTMKEKDISPQHMQSLLQMVCDESHQILALSEHHRLPSALSKGEPCIPQDQFPEEGQGLLEAVPSKGEKEPSDMCLDWRGEFLRVVQQAFEKEREILKVELQPRFCISDPGDHNSLFERLEKVVREQEDLQEKSLERLRLSDRSSLLAEIQALRAQLRRTHLQNQEKLQQLCAALTSAEARGSRQEHQLRRQVELLAYKVEQEKCIASDLQKTLSEEQEKASHVQKLLVVEQNTVKELRSELSECKQENERLLQSLNDVQKEVLQLRSMLDSKENDLSAALQELESERAEQRTLRNQLEEEQRQHLQREGQSAKSLEELRASLEEQHAQSSRLRVALKHEQATKDNLQQELQIECSRCEVLLAQERNQLSEVQKSLEAEKSRSLELSAALQHERLLTEQLSRRAREPCAAQEARVHHSLLRKLKEEKSRGAELQAMLEKVQHQAVRSQRQLEAESQRRCEELRREKEVSAALQSTVDALQTQRRKPRCCLQSEREKPAWGQAEIEQLHTRWEEHKGYKDTRWRMETRQRRVGTEKRKEWQRDKERLRELELQHQRDEHKIEQLQQMVRELQAREEGFRGSLSFHPGPDHGPDGPEMERLHKQQEDLERIRRQLLCAAGLLAGFTQQPTGRTVSDWTSSNEKTVASLLRTLEDLKAELSTSASSQKKAAAEVQIQLLDVLAKDNSSLTKALSAATREKAVLCKAVSKLEKTLKHHLQKGCTLNRLDGSDWKKERVVLPNSPGHADPGWPMPVASEETNTCNIKMEKLYLHYLRAESFRKALIYQKKYLLLLIGGFQDSEQETLSMIAHLGVFPSKADKKVTTSRPFTKFRTAVRVVVAVLRLQFLVKKWQEVDRKGALAHGKATRPGPRAPRQRQSPTEARRSPPTRDLTQGTRPSAAASPSQRQRSTPSPNSRLERSLTASQDPEQSLTEYIHHLEMIQHRLGGAPPEYTSKKSCRQKIKQ